MSDLEKLKTFRDGLVAERRQLVQSALDLIQAGNQSGIVSHAHQVQTVQQQIDAVDRAISDEQNLHGKL